MSTALEKPKNEFHTAFTQYSSYQKLEALSRTPYDLTRGEGLTPERIKNMRSQACGITFLYGTERVDDDIIHALVELAKEAQAIEKMKAMQEGEIVNIIHNYQSDKRPVLHTALRDFFSNPMTTPKAKKAAELAKNELDRLKSFLNEIDQKNEFTDLISIGIGGSDLGPQATYLSLQHLKKKNRKLHFISNLDPDSTAKVLDEVDLKQCLVVVMSKSGTTMETVSNEAFLRSVFETQGLDPKKHFISMTTAGTPIDDPNKYLKTFYIWDYIGGRFSCTSIMGAIITSFACGFEVFWEVLRGANAMDKAALEPNIKNNLPLLGALLNIWNRNFLKYPTLAIIPYSQVLFRLPAHIQQVEMESNGKRIDKQGQAVSFDTGAIIWGEPGTSAQHSFYQLIHQGTGVIPIEFIGFKKSVYNKDLSVNGTTLQEKLVSNLFAQAIALAQGQKSDNPNKVFPGNRPSHILLSEQLTPYVLGALLAYYEHKVAFEGFIWDINSFDQEGVQLGKVLADKMLKLFEKGKESKEVFPLGEAFLK